RAVFEVGGVEMVSAVVGEGEAGVDVAGLAGGDDRRGRTGGRGVRAPARDVSGDRGEEEIRPAWWRDGGTRAGKGKVNRRRRVGDRPRRKPGAAGDGDGLRSRVKNDRCAAHVAADELRRARRVVGDPKGATRAHRDAPGVDEQRVEYGREARNV